MEAACHVGLEFDLYVTTAQRVCRFLAARGHRPAGGSAPSLSDGSGPARYICIRLEHFRTIFVPPIRRLGTGSGLDRMQQGHTNLDQRCENPANRKDATTEEPLSLVQTARVNDSRS